MAKQVNLGGQAVIEGVMIQSPSKICMAVRRKDGSITLTSEQASTFSKRHAWARWPIVRGLVNLCTQLKSGYKMLNKSADYMMIDEGEETEQESGVLGAISMVAAIVLALGLFFLLPSLLAGWMLPKGSGWFNILEGVIRLLIFAGYMAVIGLWKDMKRVFMYHGAEHRVLHCIEHGLEPTPENSKKFPVVHPRCGTSYLFLVMIVSILVFSLLGQSQVLWIRLALRVVLLPLVAGLSYEVLKFAAKLKGWGAKILQAPGLWMQRLSTRLPSDDRIEVAAAAYAEAANDVG